MAGPVLGRIVKSDMQERFVSANLPMLHKGTVEDTGLSEFRPGVGIDNTVIDLSGEFERQFFGDVMLFTVEKLTMRGFPHGGLSATMITSTLVATEERVRREYNARQADILKKLQSLKSTAKDIDI